MVVDLFRRAGLLHFAAVDDEDAVAHGHGLGLVVGHIDHRDPQFLLETFDLKAHGLPELRVQVGQGLVQKEEFRLRHQGPGQGHSLLLSAGELARQTVRIFREVHEGKRPFHPLLQLLLRALPDGQGVGGVFEYCHMGPDRVVLEYHADAPLLRRNKGLPPGDGAVVKPDLAFGGPLKAGDHPEDRGLPAARGTEERDELSPADHLVHIPHHDIFSECFCDIFQGD